jgi:hypothetical protein
MTVREFVEFAIASRGWSAFAHRDVGGTVPATGGWGWLP